MSYVIGAECIDVLDRSCLAECPVDCIYEGGRKLYIHPEECIDCGACEPACPVEAISWTRDAADSAHVQDAHAFFYQPLPGRALPLVEPGGASSVGVIGVDTAYVTGLS